MTMPDFLNIEVVYALPERQELVHVRLPPGSTVQRALEVSGLLRKFPEIDLGKGKFGVYGKLAKLDATLRDRDRVEIYRPLIADPKEVRKKRAEEGKTMRKGAGEEG